MENLIEEINSLPVKGHYDVIVCGAGPAGIAAAISSARQGVKTLLIEISGMLGGVSTTGLMSHWTGETEGPLYEEILERSKDEGDDFIFEDRNLEFKNKYIINSENLKIAYIELLEEAGVDILCYTIVSKPILEGKKVKGVIIENKTGRQAVFATVVVDATGDGDVAALSGAEYVLGRKDGKMQPMTLMFKVGGVDYKEACFSLFFEDNYTMSNGVKIQDIGVKELDSPMGHVLLYPNQVPGVVTINMTNCIDVDGTKAEDLTKATIKCQKQVRDVYKFLKRNIPGYKNCTIHQTAASIGVRETRHFVGLYTITEEDIATAKEFDDWIATRCFFNFDIHNISGSGLDEHGQQFGFEQTKKYKIPYGCFVPQTIDGLLLCGRNISGTHVAHSNYRVMPVCVNMGQGVGIAAAISVKKQVELRNVSVKDIQDELRKAGVKE